jgi:hypothetical protein
MTITLGLGYAHGLDGRETAALATRNALNQIGRNTISFGIIISSDRHSIHSVLNGIISVLGEIPLLGMSTVNEIAASGILKHSVVVLLICGVPFTIKAEWWANIAEQAGSIANNIAQLFHLEDAEGTLLTFTDGLSGDAQQLCSALPRGPYTLAGGLSSCNYLKVEAFQIGGHQAGSGGVAAAFLPKDLSIGVGIAHGWKPTGKFFKVTHSHHNIIETLDDMLATEALANLFKVSSDELKRPPLNEMVRLYALGIEQPAPQPLLVRSAINIDDKGFLRMNTSIQAGSTIHIMIGSQNACLEAAHRAAQQAHAALGSSRPIFALVLADIAWKMLFEAQPNRIFEAIRQVLGADIPLAGGFTYGQLYSTSGDSLSPMLHNQHIEIILIST